MQAKLLDAGSTGELRSAAMSRKNDKSNPRQRISPTETVAHLTDDFVESLDIPPLPDSIPARLENALRRRIMAFMHYLKSARKQRYVGALELRLVRDAHRAVLTAYELGLADAEALYGDFRKLVEELGYERTEVGYRRKEPLY
jgi:hypothetical protein